jgi:hypothetical protein
MQNTKLDARTGFMANGTKWTKNPKPKDLNSKAIHFETSELHALELYQFLVSIYGSTRPIANMPYMLDLKIIPDWTSCKQGKLGAFGTDMLKTGVHVLCLRNWHSGRIRRDFGTKLSLLVQSLPAIWVSTGICVTQVA